MPEWDMKLAWRLRAYMAYWFEEWDASVEDFFSALENTEWTFADGGRALTRCEILDPTPGPEPLPGNEPRLTYPTTHMPPRVTEGGEFGNDRGTYIHNGLDLASSYAARGDQVLCALSGEVVVAGVNPDEPWFGWQVRTRTQVGDREILVRYGHFVAEYINVWAGDWVVAGDILGRPDNTGQSTGDHLHLDVKVVDPPSYLDPALLIEWPEEEPSPPAFPLRGLHDRSGAEWLLAEGLEGWAVIPLYLNTSAQEVNGLERYKDAGIHVLLRLNYSWATADGGQGTMPGPDRLGVFEQACVRTMDLNPAAWGFIYCNEMNNDREWPDGYDLSAAYYAGSYNRLYTWKPVDARLLPGAIDPTNAGWGDWRQVWPWLLNQLIGADALALHAYCHGPEIAKIRHDKQFGHAPLTGVFYDLRMLESQQEVIPARFRDLPQIVTECNHLYRGTDEEDVGWENDAGEWVREAYRYFSERGVEGVVLFRHNHDKWRFGDKPDILDALREIDK